MALQTRRTVPVHRRLYVCKQKMASADSATSVRILNENVDKLTKLPDMVKAFDELTNEEVNLLAVVVYTLLRRGCLKLD